MNQQKPASSHDREPTPTGTPLDEVLDRIGRDASAILIQNPETGAILAASAGAVELYGYSAETLRSMRITDLVARPLSELLGLLRAAAAGEAQEVDLEYLPSTGGTRQASCRLGPVEWAGRSCAFSVTLKTRRRVEDRTQAREPEFGADTLEFLAGTHVGTWEWHVQTGETRFNDRWAAICGYTLEELEPVSIDTWQKLAHPDDLELSGDRLQRHFAGELDHYDVECRMRHKDGHWVWVRDTGKVIAWTPEGLPALMLGTHIEISQQKQVEEHLRRSLSILDQSEALASFGGWHLDLEVNSLTWTDGVCRVFGIEPGKEPPTYEAFLSVVHPEDRQAVDEAYSSSVENGSPGYEIEHRIVRRDDGRTRHVVERCKHDFNEKGEVIRSIGTVQDINERKERESSRLRFEQEVQHAQKLESLGVMAGGIAHDFNNILAAIMGHAEIAALDLPAGHSARESVDVILEGVRNASELTQKMLSYAGHTAVEMAPVDLSDLVSSMSDLMRTAVPRTLTIERDIARAPSIHGDRAQLQQVILNLITNAAEAVGDRPGTVTLQTGVTDLESIWAASSDATNEVNTGALEPGAYVFLEVRDTGEGMSPDVADRIFEPFFSTKMPGRGLGMAAVMGIVRQHKGAIQFESRPGEGTRFRVLLPAIESTSTPSPKEPEVEKAALRVLIADDEEVVREAFTRGLCRMGFEVEGASDGLDALEVFHAARTPFDCVVLDLTMPRMSGPECLIKLRETHPDVPIVVASGFSSETLERSIHDSKSVVFLSKPFSLTSLHDAVLEAVKRRAEAVG